MTTGTVAGIEFISAGNGPAVICLHGIGGDASSFAHQMQAIPGHRVIAWNMPGYGGSEPLESVTFEALSRKLAAFIDDLGLERAHLLGQSIGGMIALEHGVRHPDQVASLTLVATTPRFGGRDDSFKEAFLKARLAPLDAGQSMAEMASATAPMLVGPNCSVAEIKRIETALAAVPEATWRAILQCLVTFDRHDALETLNIPALVVAGSADQNAPSRTMARMADRLPHATFHELAGAGHMLHQEMPKPFNALVAHFLDGITP